ncbi:ABC transporter substrate-binding protein [Branchiibius sp. NY16-3462-2]|uniref:ABC transporter substrate-binding protein n=1 Tax=Branchiibius sp. NY16-3462-2 TaxID=1807500 RepID=UPI000792FA9F|nr:ABC transporter substrate-binding protein [Branchiibius sp. NY16-3462-2]KYH45679.1 ABC transporter substrate-binding protein [Branchiibius sp. NY16-3462-2]
MTASHRSPGPSLDRRGLLRFAGLGGATLVSGALLSACGSSSSSSSPSATGGTSGGGKGSFGDVAVQLSWIKNIEFAGEYFAIERGYFTQAGFSNVNLLAGGGSTGAEEAVLSGKALLGLSSPSITAPQVAKGADLKIIGSTYQKNPFCLLSLEEKTPIKTVADLKGKKIGVQSGGNQTIFEGFLKANGLSPSDVTMVTTLYDLAPLYAGKYDAHMSYITNEPILAKAKGYTPVVLGFADNGLPFTAETYTVTGASIKSDRDKLKAYLKAAVQGWTAAIKDPAQSAKYAVDKYGADQKLNLTEQTAEATAQNGLIVTEDVNTNGLFTMTDDLIANNIKALKAMGTEVTAEQLFDLSLIEEVFKENPDLIVKFTIPTS